MAHDQINIHNPSQSSHVPFSDWFVYFWAFDKCCWTLRSYTYVFAVTWSLSVDSKTKQKNKAPEPPWFIPYRSFCFPSLWAFISHLQFGQFVSGIGGVLGLYIGFSIFTILEFFELAFDMIALMILKGCSRDQKKTTPHVVMKNEGWRGIRYDVNALY